MSISRDDRTLAAQGGSKACDFNWPQWPIFDQAEESALLEVLRSRKWWYGQRVEQFERQFAEYQGAQFAVSCTNGTTALEAALRALGVGEGSEVIVPAYTFVATATSVITVGAVPVFADILGDTLCIDPDDVAAKVTSRTAAIIPVHVAGRTAEMTKIDEIASAHDLAVLEDAAHAWGSRLDHRGAGVLSTQKRSAGTFSFQETKNLTAGEGGIVITNNQEIAELCRSYTHCGRTNDSAWYEHRVLGSNLRMTEFQAAILSAQVQRYPEQLNRRERNVARIDRALQDLPAVRLRTPTAGMTRRSHHFYPFRLADTISPDLRDPLVSALNAEGIPASCGWPQPLYRNALFQNAHEGPQHGILSPLANKGVDYRNVRCPITETVCADSIWLPQYVLLADDAQIERLCDGLVKVLTATDVLARSREGAES